MDKYGLIIMGIILIVTTNVFTQSIVQQSDTAAYAFKLDYDVPESPAFSIVDANPSTIMRGSAAKEFAINLANNFVSNKKQETGVAVDFNPFFVFKGRLKNVSEYTDKFGKRLLANTQLSFASISTEDFPDDNLLSGGIRISLFDDFDLLYDKELGIDINNALIPAINPPKPIKNEHGVTEMSKADTTIQIPKLKEAYSKAKQRLNDKKGGALSIGAATAHRALSGKLRADSLMLYRNQVWLSGQYNFGGGNNLLGLAMYRTTFMSTSNFNELMLGVGFRHLGKKINVGTEVIWSSEKDFLEIGANIEVLLTKGILLAVSIGNKSDMNGNNNDQLFVRPTLKYNISQSKE